MKIPKQTIKRIMSSILTRMCEADDDIAVRLISKEAVEEIEVDILRFIERRTELCVTLASHSDRVTIKRIDVTNARKLSKDR